MDIKPISMIFSTSAQIGPDDLAMLKQQGFRAIICNRPDGEAADQPSFAEIEQAAKKAGLEARHIPIQPGMMEAVEIAQFDKAMRELPTPILGYCRTGARAAALWSQSEIMAQKQRDAG